MKIIRLFFLVSMFFFSGASLAQYGNFAGGFASGLSQGMSMGSQAAAARAEEEAARQRRIEARSKFGTKEIERLNKLENNSEYFVKMIVKHVYEPKNN